ncbi:MAG: MMPL family transporter [Gammaproteobacteria bacterium]|nr:MMPL family transporter [Gammaproteobacteria bacterium]MDH3767977.1 MMPL family transporter [Gammaproteobacteria bacterium]
MNHTAYIDTPGRLVRRWVALVIRFAPIIVVLAVLSIAPMAWFVATHLGINTSTADMIAKRLPWRQAFSDYRAAFPQLDHNLVAVIDAPDADHADDARDALYMAMAARDDLFHEVFAPGSDVFFRQNAFLYLSSEQLADLADRLAQVQPFLAQLADDPTTAGLFNAIARGLAADGTDIDVSLLLTRIADVVEALNNDKEHSLSWQALMSDEAPLPARRVVVFRPRMDFARLHPAQDAVAAIREQQQIISAALPLDAKIRLTGPVALEYEELSSVSRGARTAGLLALVMVLVILYFAMRSVWLVCATLLTLITGLLATAVFAALAIGSLNLISIAFTVLYIGLGVDFAIHYSLRFREALAAGASTDDALIDSAGDVGASLVLCAVTTSIGFFAFFPTTFRGVSELGIISGTGMYISLIVTLTLLPALLKVLPKSQSFASAVSLTGHMQRISRSRLLLPAAAVLSIAALAALPYAGFDSDPINLRDATSESVATYYDLLDDPQYSPRSLSVIANDASDVTRIRAELSNLDTVKSLSSIGDFVPTEQPDKLALIEEIALIMGPDLSVTDTSVDTGRDRAAISKLSDVLQNEKSQQAARLARALDGFLPNAATGTDPRLTLLNRMLVGTLPGRLSALNDALSADRVALEDLPTALRDRWISADGRRRVEIQTDVAKTEFVDSVRAVIPAATGLPVLQREGGRAVVGAFRQAFITAFVLISLILLVLLRNARQVVVVLVPLIAAGLGTVAVMVLVDQPFNFANVIALPLLLGVGVDNGIHMVHRWRSGAVDLLASSTSRAIFFSALTTIASFGNLAFSSHPGSASMGRVLTIGMILTTAFSVLLIPALLDRQR